MKRHILLASMMLLAMGVATAQAGHWPHLFHHHHHIHHGPQFYTSYPPTVGYYAAPVAYQPVFAAPTTVVVQRPVYVAQPVVVQRPVYIAQPVIAPEPVFIETPAVVTQQYVVPQSTVVPVGYPTTINSYRVGHYDKTRYNVYTPFGTHKYIQRTSRWTGRTYTTYEFDD